MTGARAEPLVIGIDASRALSNTPSGTENYSRQLIGALLRQNSRFRFRLYTRTNPPPNVFPPTSNYDIRAMSFPRLWTHARLSYEMLMRAPSALIVPAHVLPLIHPRHSLVTVHDLGYLHFPQSHRTLDRLYLDLATRWSARWAEYVIADSNATRADLVHFYNVPPAKIRVIYPAFERELFARVAEPARIATVRARYGLGDEYLLAVGTMHPRKNYLRLIQAFIALPEEYQLAIVGSRGWLYGEIFAEVERQHLATRVRFLDYVSADDLSALYAGARLLVFPSLYEGFGFPVLEAQASGTPVVCSNTSSLPEVAGEAAEFFNPLDTAEMVHALARVLNDSARRDELVARGRVNAERFSWTRAASEILERIEAMNSNRTF